MMEFINKDFILETETARSLFHNYSEDLPIIDYHCHISPKEIYEDIPYENITQIWLYGDHYKWRIMRACGIEERYITGDASDREKFIAFAGALELAVGNPLYHWCHLELKKYFGYDGVLNEKTCDEVWDLTTKVIKEKELSPRKIIGMSNVEVICTTDDPIDDLSWHEKIANEIDREGEGFSCRVYPAWRPDKAVNIDKDTFSEYIDLLETANGKKIGGFDDLKKTLSGRMDYFRDRGCRVSDHGLDYVPFNRCEDVGVLDSIFQKGRSGKPLSPEEADAYKTEILIFCAEEYRKRGWVMQLHFGCARNINSVAYGRYGADSGFDSIGERSGVNELLFFLDQIEKTCGLPKTILYSLDPNDDAVLDTIIGAFYEDGVRGKVQHGSAWWFNDHKPGMEAQLRSFAARNVLGNFVGMLTDSRSFLSYTRHDYFRRILCNMLGDMVEKGELPNDADVLGKIVEKISYENAKEYFGF